MSLRNEIHRNNQINVKQLIILFNTIIRVIFPASTLSSERRTTATFDETRGYLHAFWFVRRLSWSIEAGNSIISLLFFAGRRKKLFLLMTIDYLCLRITFLGNTAYIS